MVDDDILFTNHKPACVILTLFQFLDSVFVFIFTSPMLLLSPRCKESRLCRKKRIGVCFFLKKSSTQVLFLGPLIPYFGLLVMSVLGFKDRICLLRCLLSETDSQIHFWWDTCWSLDRQQRPYQPFDGQQGSALCHTWERDWSEKFPCLLSSNHLFYCQFFISHLFPIQTKKRKK